MENSCHISATKTENLGKLPSVHRSTLAVQDTLFFLAKASGREKKFFLLVASESKTVRYVKYLLRLESDAGRPRKKSARKGRRSFSASGGGLERGL